MLQSLTYAAWLWRRFSAYGIAQGGFLFLRPCAAVGDHMRNLSSANPMLQYREDPRPP